MRTMLITAAIALTFGALPAEAGYYVTNRRSGHQAADDGARPGDKTTTDQVTPTPGISGEAPSRELTGQGNTGVPGSTPQAKDAPEK